MSSEELSKLCHKTALEIHKLLTSEQWDAIQTYAETLNEADARTQFDRLREYIHAVLDCEDPEARSRYILSLPVASRNLTLFFARIAASQAADVASAVANALDAIDGLETPVRLLAESLERSEEINRNYLGLF